MMRSWLHVAVLLIVTARLAAEEAPLRRVPGTPPTETIATLRLQNGFRAELVAAEPLVCDPVAIAYDENGLAYVAEMIDYPYSDPSHDQAWKDQTSAPIGRVRVLADVDGDGVFDRSTVFAENLSWPSGIACSHGGVYVAATPDVWYLKDTDGDHKADERRAVFQGFRKYNVQAVMNNLQWGLDHKLYGAGSSNSGKITQLRHPDLAAVTLGRNDFRFDPGTETLEIIPGGARFGQGVDDWGERYLTNIRNPVQQVVLPTEVVGRNPFALVGSPLQDVVPSGDAVQVYPVSPPEPWRVVNAARLAADSSKNSPFDSTVASGYVTSSSGVTIYRGTAWPEDFRGNAFVGEVAGNLVMRFRLQPDGATVRGEQPYVKSEFLASTDNWFRPVNFANAPDGTLHVLDMCRETIEHPWSMPDDLKSQADLTSGRDRGRIYRLWPETLPADYQRPPAPRLGQATTEELVRELSNPNGWWRDTAHRLLFERQEPSAVEPLRAVVTDGTSPVGRVQALWSLLGLQSLAPADLSRGLADSDAHVRAHAVRLAAMLWDDHPSLLAEVLPLADDANPRVRFEVAVALGGSRDPRVVESLATIARHDIDDSWQRTVLLCSLPDLAAPLLERLLQDPGFLSAESSSRLIEGLAQTAAGHGGADVALATIRQLPERSPQSSIAESSLLAGLGAGLLRRKQSLAALADVNGSPERQRIARAFDDALATVRDRQAGEARRLSAIQLLSYANVNSAGATLLELVDAAEPPAVQSAALTTLTKFPEPTLAAPLLERYRRLTPTIQQELVDRLQSRSIWVPPLLAAVESGAVEASRISTYRRTQYLQSTSAEIKMLAEKLFAADRPSPRAEVLSRYRNVPEQTGDRTRGQSAFVRECQTCHRLGAIGHDVGPNLATIRNRNRKEIMTQILDPNREVAPNFLQYIAVTEAGESVTGIITAESPHSLTFRSPDGRERALLRSEIEELRSSGVSLMPEGLEQKITPDEMADLLE
ncbi:MAG: PVC-type heme-binding CxxCH protein, partial [Planctomycetaceae bacterium]